MQHHWSVPASLAGARVCVFFPFCDPSAAAAAAAVVVAASCFSLDGSEQAALEHEARRAR